MSKILVVDDDPDIGVLVKTIFEAEGFQVEPVVDSRQVTARVEAWRPDAVVLDLAMPHKTGWQILEELQNSLRTREVPVLVVSASADREDRVRALRSGAEDFLVKPFDAAELLARVDLVLARRRRDAGLAGELKGFPLVELLQSLENGRKSGLLILESATLRGEIHFREGLVVAAKRQRLSGREALFALLELDDACFQFLEQAVQASPDEDLGSRLDWLLMEAAWVADELAARHHRLPPLDAVLRSTGVEKEIPEEFAELPVREVLSFLENVPSPSLGGAIESLLLAPQRIRFAIALLLERGTLVVEGDVAPVAPEGNRAVTAVSDVAAGIRRGREPLLTVLFQQGVEAELAALLALPPELSASGLEGREVELDAHGERFRIWFSPVRLDAVSEIVARAARSCGVVLWLGAAGRPLEIPPRLLRAAAGAQARVLAVGGPASLKLIGSAPGGSGWRTRSRDEIRSLAQLLDEVLEVQSAVVPVELQARR